MTNGVLPQQSEKHAALCFVGPLQHPWSQSLRNVLCGYANENMTHLTLLMSSTGGSLMDGFAIFNLLQALPYEVHTHNLGSVQSIANIVFLAGYRRTAAPESSFMLHGFTWTFGQETLDEMQIAERTGHITTARAEFVRIFECTTTLTAKDFEEQKFFGRAKIILPDDAKNAGIIHDIGHIDIPPGGSYSQRRGRLRSSMIDPTASKRDMRVLE